MSEEVAYRDAPASKRDVQLSYFLAFLKDVFELCLFNNAEKTIERKMGLELVGSDNSCENILLWPDN